MLLGKKENIFVLLILITLASTITYVQYNKWVYGTTIRADSGFLLEMTQNIANDKGPISSIHAAMNNFFRNNLQVTPVEEYSTKELGRVPEEFRYVFDSHRYYIVYVTAFLSKIFDTKAVYYTAHVFGFFLLLYLVYRILRENRVGMILSGLFLCLVFVHPAFSLSISGQLYAERFFIPFTMLFLYFLNKKDTHLFGLYISAFLVCLVSERAPLMVSIFIFGYVILLWNSIEKQKKIHLVSIGSVLLAFALYSFNVLRTSGGLYYTKSTFLPTGIDDLLYRFSLPTFQEHLMIFAIFSFLFLGLFTIFRWRLLLLALVMMLPNIVGSIGGAEKYGYLTHYHTLYFPFLVFSATLGFIKMVEIVNSKNKIFVFIIPLFMVSLITLSAASSPYNKNISLDNITKENAFLKDIGLYPEIFQKESFLRQTLDKYHSMNDLIPDGSIVSSGEMAQVILWKNKIHYFYPMGIDVADYAVLFTTKTKDGFEYSGAVSYLGAEEAKKIDRYIIERMHKLGYDFKNQKIINGFAIIKRVKND